MHGTELPAERELAEALGVSRFSLREALRVAQAQGLIEISRGRRPRVAAPSADAAARIIEITLRRTDRTLLDLADARIVLEAHIAREAATRVSDTDIAQLQETIDLIVQNKCDPDLCAEQDIRFHALLVKATGNVVFEVMLAPLALLLREARKETLRQGTEPVLNGHTAILSALRRHDPDAAEHAMRTHLELAQAHIRQSAVPAATSLNQTPGITL